jgi:hypothetical protein
MMRMPSIAGLAMKLIDRVCKFPAMFSWWRLIAVGSFISYLAAVGYAQAAELLRDDASPRYERSELPSDESLPPQVRKKVEDNLMKAYGRAPPLAPPEKPPVRLVPAETEPLAAPKNWGQRSTKRRGAFSCVNDHQRWGRTGRTRGIFTGMHIHDVTT